MGNSACLVWGKLLEVKSRHWFTLSNTEKTLLARNSSWMITGWAPWVGWCGLQSWYTEKVYCTGIQEVQAEPQGIPSLKVSGFTFRMFRQQEDCRNALRKRGAANNNWLSHEVKLASKRMTATCAGAIPKKQAKPPRHCKRCPFLPMQHCFPQQNTAEGDGTDNRGGMPLALWMCTRVCLLPQGENVMYSEMYT